MAGAMEQAIGAHDTAKRQWQGKEAGYQVSSICVCCVCMCVEEAAAGQGGWYQVRPSTEAHDHRQTIKRIVESTLVVVQSTKPLHHMNHMNHNHDE